MGLNQFTIFAFAILCQIITSCKSRNEKHQNDSEVKTSIEEGPTTEERILPFKANQEVLLECKDKLFPDKSGFAHYIRGKIRKDSYDKMAVLLKFDCNLSSYIPYTIFSESVNLKHYNSVEAATVGFMGSAGEVKKGTCVEVLTDKKSGTTSLATIEDISQDGIWVFVRTSLNEYSYFDGSIIKQVHLTSLPSKCAE